MALARKSHYGCICRRSDFRVTGKKCGSKFLSSEVAKCYFSLISPTSNVANCFLELSRVYTYDIEMLRKHEDCRSCCVCTVTIAEEKRGNRCAANRSALHFVAASADHCLLRADRKESCTFARVEIREGRTKDLKVVVGI